MIRKKQPVKTPMDLETYMKKVLDAMMEKDDDPELIKMNDDELMDAAGSVILYGAPFGLVGVHPLNSMSKEELIEALYDIAEAVKQHGVPDKPMMLKKRPS